MDHGTGGHFGKLEAHSLDYIVYGIKLCNYDLTLFS